MCEVLKGKLVEMPAWSGGVRWTPMCEDEWRIGTPLPSLYVQTEADGFIRP